LSARGEEQEGELGEFVSSLLEKEEKRDIVVCIKRMRKITPHLPL
jgi:hypothetical protein